MVVTKVVTKAYTEKNVLIHAKGTTADISVKADDDYSLIAVVGTISASGVAAGKFLSLVGLVMMAVIFLIEKRRTKRGTY